MDTFTWAERLMYEKLAQNDYYMKLKVLDHKIDYGKRQIAKIFFHLHSLLNIRNSKHIGPIQKQLTDIMLSKQGELKYLFTVLNHFSVIGSLNYSNQHQKVIANQRNIQEEIQQLGNKTFTLIYDNFVRTKTISDSLHTDKQTQEIPLLTQTMLALPPTPDCDTCRGTCSCTWSNDSLPKDIDYSIIQLNDMETENYDDCTFHNRYQYLRKVSDSYKNLLALRDERKPAKDLENCIPPMSDVKSTWKLSKKEDTKVDRLTLPCVVGMSDI